MWSKIKQSEQFQMFEFSNWQIEEPEIDDASKYDNLVPTVVKSPASDMVR